MSSTLRICKLLYNSKAGLLFKKWGYLQRAMLVMNIRRYEGKPFDQKDKNWAEDQDKNRFYDIDQNIYEFRRREEMKMKEKYYQDKAQAKYDKHRSRMEHDFKVAEDWNKHNAEKRKQENWQNFTFTTNHSDIPKSDTQTMNNMATYALIGGVGVMGIGFLLIKSQ